MPADKFGSAPALVTSASSKVDSEPDAEPLFSRGCRTRPRRGEVSDDLFRLRCRGRRRRAAASIAKFCAGAGVGADGTGKSKSCNRNTRVCRDAFFKMGRLLEWLIEELKMKEAAATCEVEIQRFNFLNFG